MFAEGLNMRQYDERRHHQSARVKLTNWLLRCIRDKGGIDKETEIEEALLKYTNCDRVRVVDIFRLLIPLLGHEARLCCWSSFSFRGKNEWAITVTCQR
jgi:hypothetical protein